MLPRTQAFRITGILRSSDGVGGGGRAARGPVLGCPPLKSSYYSYDSLNSRLRLGTTGNHHERIAGLKFSTCCSCVLDAWRGKGRVGGLGEGRGGGEGLLGPWPHFTAEHPSLPRNIPVYCGTSFKRVGPFLGIHHS